MFNVCVCVCVHTCSVSQLCPTVCGRTDCSLPGSLPWNFPGKNTGVGFFLTPGNLPDPRIKPMSLASPTLAGGFFTISTPGKPRY